MRKPFQKIAPDVKVDDLSPLNVTCTSAKCDDNLHCYRQKPKRGKKSRQGDLWIESVQKGSCWACQISLVDWHRVYRKDLSDVTYTLDMLKTELVRYVYWHTEVDQWAKNYALRKGRIELRFAAENRLRKAVANSKNPYEGRQTRKKRNIIYYAQHATACCCRNCIEYWYNIPSGIQLNDTQINYFVELIMLYVSTRMPNL